MNTSELSIEQATEALSAREPIFHRPELGTTQAEIEAMVAPEFWEVGASGARYSKEYVVQLVTERHSIPMDEFYGVTESSCQELAPDISLYTYQLDQAGRTSQRSTIWRHISGVWQIVFHQGTLVAG